MGRPTRSKEALSMENKALSLFSIFNLLVALTDATCCRKTPSFPNCSLPNPCIPYTKQECQSKSCEYLQNELDSGDAVCKESCNWAALTDASNSTDVSDPLRWKIQADNLDEMLSSLPAVQDHAKLPPKRRARAHPRISKNAANKQGEDV